MNIADALYKILANRTNKVWVRIRNGDGYTPVIETNWTEVHKAINELGGSVPDGVLQVSLDNASCVWHHISEVSNPDDEGQRIDQLKDQRDELAALLREADKELDGWDDGKIGRRDFRLEADIDAVLAKLNNKENDK